MYDADLSRSRKFAGLSKMRRILLLLIPLCLASTAALADSSEFVDKAVPELQRRGLYRTEYKGNTQRELLRQND